MRARYYNQDIRRFINRDVVSGEITNSQSLNRYCYVQGNPVSLTDPFGLCPDSNSAFKNLCINLYHMDWNAIGHAALDAAGVFFEGADVINAIWYVCEGNMEMAAASAICAIPGVGLAAGNLLMKSNKLAAAGKAVKAIAKLTQGTMGVCAGIETARTGFTNFLNGLEAGTFDAGAFLQTLGGIGIAVLSGKSMVPSGRELLACEEGLSQLWNSAKSKVSKGIRERLNDNRGYVDLDALKGICSSSATRRQAFRAAKRATGIPESAQYIKHEFVYDGMTEHRIVYEFEVNNESKFIIEHLFDGNGRGNHFHGADGKKGSPYNKGTYNQYHGHFPEDMEGFK